MLLGLAVAFARLEAAAERGRDLAVRRCAPHERSPGRLPPPSSPAFGALREINALQGVSGEEFHMDAHVQPVVFIVDDDEAVRRALAFALDLEGLTAETFATGEALLLHALPQANACLVIDERLPGISGLDTLRQLRARNVRLPAILTTSYPKPILRAAAAEVGAPILDKPLLGEALVAAIRAALDDGDAPSADSG